jgi:hypothetical protein
MPFIPVLYLNMKIHIMLTFVSVILQSAQFIDMETWLRYSLCMLLLHGVQLLYV